MTGFARFSSPGARFRAFARRKKDAMSDSLLEMEVLNLRDVCPITCPYNCNTYYLSSYCCSTCNSQ